MKTTAAAALGLLLLLGPLAHGGERAAPKTWIDHVRYHTVRSAQAVGKEVSRAMAGMRRTAVQVRDDAAKGLASITIEGRRGLAAAVKATRQASATAFRETRETLITGLSTVVPIPTKPLPEAPVTAARKLESPILTPHFLRGHDILLAWHLDTGDHPIRASAVFEDRLLLETEGRDLYSFTPATGVLHWLFALPGASQGEYSGDASHIFVIASDVYFEIDRTVGRPRRRFILPFPASNPPAVEGDIVAICSWERRLYALNRETRVKEWTYVPDENVVGAAIAVPNMLYIADTGGNLTAYSPVERREKWTYKALDGIRVSPLMVGDDLVFPAEDLYVHCVNRFGGLRHWKFPVQGQVTQPVAVDGEAILFSAKGDALYAVDHKTGKLLWKVANGGWPVALGKENIYIEGPDREIWCLDRKTGTKQWAVSAKPFTYFVRNTANDHIYLCTATGEVYAFYLRGDHLEKKAPPPEKKAPVPLPPGKHPVEPEPGGAAPGAESAPPAAAPAPAPKAAEEEF